MELAFWIFIFLVFYAYLGYGILLFLLVKLKTLFKGRDSDSTNQDPFLPPVTFIVAAYNEENWIEDKIRNCLAFDYPNDRIEFWFVTDGSDDRTPDLVRNFPAPPGVSIQLFHQPERQGKIAAVKRIMPLVETPITIFTDANTDVNPGAIRCIVRHYADAKVGAVAGEKRIEMGEKGDATGSGEGIYWKYESRLKTWDSMLYSVVGAAGELFSIRTELFYPVPKDTYIEDFVMTVKIAQNGYRVVYEPGAYAVEKQSASMEEEMKRKVRIAAGGLQAAWRLRSLLLPFKNPVLTFQYISHRFLRWVVAPFALPVLFLLNIQLAASGSLSYQVLLAGQVLFYLLAFIGYLLERRQLKVKALFVPYYFCFMNFAMYRGLFRLLGRKQSVKWEKARRSGEPAINRKISAE